MTRAYRLEVCLGCSRSLALTDVALLQNLGLLRIPTARGPALCPTCSERLADDAEFGDDEDPPTETTYDLPDDDAEHLPDGWGVA